MTGIQWNERHVEYLVGSLVWELCEDEEGDTDVDMRQLYHAVLSSEPPFRDWSEEVVRDVAIEVLLSMERRGLANFFEDTPRIEGKTHWSMDELIAWRQSHPVRGDRLEEWIRREMATWLAAGRGNDLVFLFTDATMEICVAWRENIPQTFEDYLTSGSR